MKPMMIAALLIATSIRGAIALDSGESQSFTAQEPGGEQSVSTQQVGGERFAAVSVGAGQGLRAVVSNVVVPAAGAEIEACPVLVRFFGADGKLVGQAQTVQLMPGQSSSVSAPLVAALTRAVVSIVDFTDPHRMCAVRTSLELFDAHSGNAIAVITAGRCIGNGRCSTSMVAPTTPAAGKSTKARHRAKAASEPKSH